MLEGAIIGVGVALVIMLINAKKARAGTGLPGELERALHGKGPQTLTQVAELVGKNTLMGRGRVAQALNALHGAGKVKIVPAPPGTPQLKKVEHITYEVAG